MEYYEPEVIMEETIENYAINYVDSWAEEYQSTVQSIVDKYLMIENKPIEELDDDDIWSLDGLIFYELDALPELGMYEEEKPESSSDSGIV